MPYPIRLSDIIDLVASWQAPLPEPLDPGVLGSSQLKNKAVLRDANQAEERTATIPMERILDAQTASIVDQIKLLLQDLRAKGLDEDQIASIVRKEEGTGRVVIDRGYLVLLDEKDIRVRLTPMERTLYTFLSRYPDGVAPDSLWRYWDELKDIYESQSVFADMELIEDSIDAICEDDRKTLYTNISRIRKKLKDKGGDWIAQRYSIRRNDEGLYVLPVKMKGC